MKRRLAIGLALGACSTAAPPVETPACTDDSDCAEGEICVREQGLCVDGSQLAPIEILGFDIREVAGGNAQFRVEVAGCDETVDSRSSERRELDARRNLVSQFITLQVFRTPPLDPDAPTLEELLPARLELSQPSRFARSPTPLTWGEDHPNVQDEGAIRDTQVRWPRYHPDDDLPPVYDENGFILWHTEPAPDLAAWRYQMLMPGDVFPDRPCEEDRDCCPEDTPDCEPPKGTCVASRGLCRPIGAPEFKFSYLYADACDRPLQGEVVAVDESLAELRGVAEASINLRHADLEGEPLLGQPALSPVPLDERPLQCDDDSDCVPGEQFCDEASGQCFLALAGRDAAPEVRTSEMGQFATRVFTYCQGPADIVERGFTATVRVVPPESSASYVGSYALAASFDPIGEAKPTTRLSEPLCVPDLGIAGSVTLVPKGDPVELLAGTGLRYACCEVSCLPATENDAMMTPVPSPPDQCPNTQGSSPAVVRLTSAIELTPDEAALWTDEEGLCAPAVLGPGNSLASIRSDATCSPETATCTADVLGGMMAPDTYAVRVEMPDGAVLGSVTTTVSLSESIEQPIEIELPPRVLVRGRVSLGPELCDPETEADCGSPGALVLAERLAMPGENEVVTPGPYFHEVTTFYDPLRGQQGSYVLPLDPGVYVVTALPLSGTPGGPARFEILTVREDERGKTVPQDFQLDPGIPVTLDVSSFDRRSQVTPLDRGSWRFGDPLIHPGYERPLDLNAVEECLISSQEGSSDEQGCRIRRLTSSSSLALTQVGKIRFTSRNLDGAAAVDCG